MFFTLVVSQKKNVPNQYPELELKSLKACIVFDNEFTNLENICNPLTRQNDSQTVFVGCICAN